MGTWIVTGATKGLGRALVENLLKTGHSVTFCGREPLRQSAPPKSRYAIKVLASLECSAALTMPLSLQPW